MDSLLSSRGMCCFLLILAFLPLYGCISAEQKVINDAKTKEFALCVHDAIRQLDDGVSEAFAVSLAAVNSCTGKLKGATIYRHLNRRKYNMKYNFAEQFVVIVLNHRANQK